MLHGGELLGASSLGGPSRDFTEQEIQEGTEVAPELAIAVSRARMTDRVRRTDARCRREIFDDVPIGVVMTGTDGTRLSANPASARTLGYASPEEAMASHWSGVLGMYVDTAARNA